MEPSALVKRILELGPATGWRDDLIACLPGIDAEPFLTQLKAEAERYWGIDPHVSLHLADGLVLAAEWLQRPRHRALGVMAQADALRLLGEHQAALPLFEAAGQAFLALGDEVGWARTRIGWLFSSHYMGQGADALAVVEQAHHVLTRHGEWLRAAGLNLNAAAVSRDMGQHDQALELYDRALGLFEQTRQADPTLEATTEIRSAKVHANQAIILLLRGEFERALHLHELARTIFEKHGQTVSVHLQEANIADVYAGQGHYTRALHLYLEDINALEQADLLFEASIHAFSLIECYLNLNLATKALELAETIVGRFETFNTPTAAAKARVYCALAHKQLGAPMAALACLDQAAIVFSQVGLRVHSAIVALFRAQLYSDEQDWAAAYAAASQARTLFVEHGLPIRRAQADLALAQALWGEGQLDSAARAVQSALDTAETLDVPWLVHEGYHLLGKIAARQDQLSQAVVAYQSAIHSIERVQGRLAFELRPHFLDDKLQVYQDIIGAYLALGELSLAFAYLERAKSRALVDYLANHVDIRLKARLPGNQLLLNELTRLREEHNWFYHHLYSRHLAAPDTASAQGITDAGTDDTLQAAIFERERAITSLLERLAVQQEEVDVPGQSWEAHHVRPQLDAHTALLEFYFHAQGGSVFILTQEGLQVVPLTVRPAEIERLLRNWRLHLEACRWAVTSRRPLDSQNAIARRLLQSLYQQLIAPVAQHIAAFERLVIVPYGITHSVPFHALYDGQHYLIERWEVIYSPSSRLLELCETRPQPQAKTALVLAYTNQGQLPDVLTEADAVLGLLGGEGYYEAEAMRAQLVTRAPYHGVLHLATHGDARLDNPTFAHIALADGPLSVVDVFNLDLDGTLVTLSACETGQSVVTRGDELVGLSRAFLYAGASSLVQSLWRVEDQATAAWMTHFYRGLRDGGTKSAALRHAQLALLDERDGLPYFWAPFQLIGASGAL